MYLIFIVECKDIIKLLCIKPLKCSIYLYCLIIRRWHKINIPDTSRPSAMTHRDDEKKEAVSEAISFLYPVMKYALLLLHQLHIRESGRIPFLTIWHTSTHIKKTTNVTTSRNQYICTYTYYCTHLIIQIISMFQFHAKLSDSNNIIKCFKL